MTASEVKVGGSYAHKLHGACIVTRVNKSGCWIQVWGGPCGDKLYTFKGIDAADLECLR